MVDFLEFTGLVRCFSAMLPCFRKKSKPENPQETMQVSSEMPVNVPSNKARQLRVEKFQGFKALKMKNC